jgi:hypothetical protein
MKNMLIMMLACAACAACVPPQPLSFEKTEISPEQVAQDQAECEFSARRQPDSCMQMQIYEQCMTSKRYAAIPGSADRGTCGATF